MTETNRIFSPLQGSLSNKKIGIIYFYLVAKKRLIFVRESALFMSMCLQGIHVSLIVLFGKM